MHIKIGYKNALSHLLNIELSVHRLNNPTNEFMLPAWRPGRYELQNYAQNMYRVKAFDATSNAQLVVRKSDRNTWVIENGSAGSIVIKYQYYALQMDAGGSWLDEEQVYINFINCILYNEQLINDPITIDFNFPIDYTFATGLSRADQKKYSAINFHELVDSPIIASRSLVQLSYQVDQTVFNIWFQGAGKINKEQIISDFKAFTQTQMELFGGFPTSEYHFLIQLMQYPKYHGVEHHNSTVITLGPDIDFKSEKSYNNLLGISSHELFHVWNVKRIRPKELTPYDFSQPTYFETGYIAEGVTTYYGDLILLRSGVFDQDQYFNEVNKYLKRHFDNPGRHQFSVAESSCDLWVDGYRKSAPKRKVSIYIKGALAAMILDLSLRQMSDHKYSIDDVMRALWAKWQSDGAGYTTQDYQDTIEELTGQSWQWYFDDIIYGTKPLEEILNKKLEFIGCKIVPKYVDPVQNYLGISLSAKYTILDVAIDGPAYDILSEGDEIIKLNGVLIDDINEDLNWQELTVIELDLIRFGRKLVVKLSKNDERFFPTYKLEYLPNVNMDGLSNPNTFFGRN